MKGGIASDLIACHAAFAEVKIPWVITDGIVLGYVRHGDIMDWDTDLDLAVFKELSDSEWRRLHKSLASHGFRTRAAKQDFIYSRRRVKLNLWLFHRNGKYYEAFPKTTPGLKFVEKVEWYENPRTVKFLGKTFLIPAYTENYLDTHYGKDWRTRIVKNHKAWFNEKRRRALEGELWPIIVKTK